MMLDHDTSIVVPMLPFPIAPCACVGTHVPKALVVELHHVFPQGEQKRIYGYVKDNTTVPLCSTGHDNAHVMLKGLLAVPQVQPSVYANAYLRGLALRGYEMIRAAEAATGSGGTAWTP